METDEILLLLLLIKKVQYGEQFLLEMFVRIELYGARCCRCVYFSEGSWSRVMTLEACMASRHQPSVIMELVLPSPP